MAHGTIGAAQEASRKPESQTDEASTFSAKPTETLRRESVAQSKNDCAIARREAAEMRGGKCGEQSITTASDVRRTSVRSPRHSIVTGSKWVSPPQIRSGHSTISGWMAPQQKHSQAPQSPGHCSLRGRSVSTGHLQPESQFSAAISSDGAVP